MCGIAGRYNYLSLAPAGRDELERMAALMVHRGPEGEGFHLDGPIGLAHRRLAIIDIEGGVQPMSTPDGALTICYNGEVFNYLELFDELRARGHRPQTTSDTESVLLAYAEWGLDFPRHLNGMFAIAIWDAVRRRLVLCRDRMGIKPLYYAETPDGLVFASEVKALLSASGVDTTLDLESVDEYMTLGYVVHPKSMLRGVKKLDPATLFVLQPDRKPERHVYWALQFDPDPKPTGREWAARLRELFDDSVRLQLRSDVALGVLLSGGVDSTAIAATIARHNPAQGVDSFCIGVDIPGAMDDLRWAREIAHRLGTRHHEYRISPEEHGKVLREAAQLLDEPLVEPMVGQLLALCRSAKKHVTVVLSGEGADETWLGYNAYRLTYGYELVQRLVPAPFLGRLVTAFSQVADYVPMSSRLARHIRIAAEPLERRYLGLHSFDMAVKWRLYSRSLRCKLAGREDREIMRRLYDGAGGPEAASKMAAVDCRAWLVDNTLLRSDQMSMAASIELRVPFLDYRLVELAARIPVRHKLRPHDQKVVLKRALSDRVPGAILRRRKHGFPTPLAALLRGKWGRDAEEILVTPSVVTADLFDRDVIKRMIVEHRSGAKDWSQVLYQVLMLEYWGRGAASGSAYRHVAA